MIAAHLRPVVCALVLFSPALAAAQHGSPVPTAADPQALARAKAQEGLKLYGADRWSEALASFREADTLFHAPSLTLYVARCQRKLGRLVDARTTYVRILAEDLPTGAPPAFVSAHADAGKELELVRQRVPTLQVAVTGVPAGEAQVTVNGAPFAEEKKDLDPGSYTVEARARGGAPVVRTVTLVEGSHETVAFDLRASADTPATTQSAPNHVPAYVSWGIGGAGLIVGAVFGGLALAQVSTLKSECQPVHIPCTSPNGASDKSGADTKAWVSNGGFALALAGAVVGTVLFFTASPAKQSAFKNTLGPGGLVLRF
jgi:hypothetical protein